MNLRRRLPLLYWIVILGAVVAILGCTVGDPLCGWSKASRSLWIARGVASSAGECNKYSATLAGGFSIVEWHMDASAVVIEGLALPDPLGAVYIRGEVLNGNSQAAGVELEVVSRDASDSIVDSTTFWAAGPRNIPAKGSSPIFYRLIPNSAATKFDLRIGRARVW